MKDIAAVVNCLRDGWTHIYRGNCAIVTKHLAGVGANILVNATYPLNIVSLHLDYIIWPICCK